MSKNTFSLLKCYLILYIEKPKLSTKHLLELVTEFNNQRKKRYIFLKYAYILAAKK
jgi:hypothetical protein